MNPLKWIKRFGGAWKRDPKRMAIGTAAVIALLLLSKWLNVPFVW